MRRRGAGVAALQSRQTTQQKYRAVGEQMHAENISQLSEQMAVFKAKLEEFAKKHRNAIRRDPDFRRHFQQMCTSIGVDPLSSNKGFWSQMLGMGDFYYELGVQVLECCIETREQNGGLMDIKDVCRRVLIRRGSQSQQISIDDIERAVKKLQTLGNGLEIRSLGDVKVIKSVPVELDTDHTAILTLAHGNDGHMTASDISGALRWAPQRVDNVMDHLMKEGLVWVDFQHPSGSSDYWFPAFIDL
eukprot:GCRY01003028.1.p1 GENE.GCRY01003028.1~~GCRY01003028.1.p1  ORF type:complete len:245 (-),score=19.03 GCRY01003028.1:167-901(-)